jgi:hypothetical protein
MNRRLAGYWRRELAQLEADLGAPQMMLSCPYLLTGTQPCVTGCWSEPRCITDEPAGGWQSEVRTGALYIAEICRDIAYEARGNHRLVKRARDLMRQADKAAR